MRSSDGKVAALERMLGQVRRKARTMSRPPEVGQDGILTRPASESEVPAPDDDGPSTAESRVFPDPGGPLAPGVAPRRAAPPEVAVKVVEEDPYFPPRAEPVDETPEPRDVIQLVGGVSGRVTLGALFDEALSLRF